MHHQGVVQMQKRKLTLCGHDIVTILGTAGQVQQM